MAHQKKICTKMARLNYADHAVVKRMADDEGISIRQKLSDIINQTRSKTMKYTGYEYEAKVIRDQANKNWLAATDRDPYLPDYTQYCKLMLSKSESAQELFSSARDIAYYERNGVDQSDAIRELLIKIEQHKCKHADVYSVTQGTPPDNYFDEAWCRSCGMLIHSDALHGYQNYDEVIAEARGELL